MTLALLVLFGACNGSPPPPRVAQTPVLRPPSSGALVAEDFEGVEVGALPTGFAAAETNGAGQPARWAVVAGDSGRCVRVETTNTGQTFNLLLGDRSLPADLECSVRLRAVAGHEDQGGGLVWRARGPTDYYITRWNPLEQNLRVYKVVGAVRTQLQSANVEADAKAWHELVASMVGNHIRVTFDGKPLLDVEDGTFSEGGYVGLWTKADASTAFDDLRVTTPASR